ncbi:N-acetyltransferase [Dyella tabacisoli]|uniref:N-acetyltransferase n=2 Tax=Dyella tabacisoli TaxID=2282381 RepID=A0A369UUN8_9GAMM|nr:N-acetyltransferase [Dyella tabacisoli]
MLIRDIQLQEVESVRQFLCANGWAQRVGDAEQFALLLANSQRTAVAILDRQIIGFARAITDGISNGYLSMLIVSSEHRHQGVGRGLVQHITGDNPNITWVLRAGREGAATFFAKLGFQVSSIAMERLRS